MVDETKTKRKSETIIKVDYERVYYFVD